MALDNVKAVFFDFDNTLVIWPNRKDDWKGLEEHFKKIIKSENLESDFWGDTLIPNNMKVFVSAMKEYTEELYVLSHEECSLWAGAKRSYVSDHYPDSFKDVICIGSPEYKVAFLRAYAEVNRLKHCEIVLIDDMCSTLKAARAEGFITVNPLEVLSCTRPEGYAAQLAKGK